MTYPGGKHEGKPVKLLAIERAFLVGTDRPAQISHSAKIRMIRIYILLTEIIFYWFLQTILIH